MWGWRLQPIWVDEYARELHNYRWPPQCCGPIWHAACWGMPVDLCANVTQNEDGSMNYTAHTQELTASLQELTARRGTRKAGERRSIPKSVAERELVLSSEVESFLDRRQSYVAQTKRVSVGTY
jgi:hypothetical protein